MVLLAVIDVGTNALRLAIGKADGSRRLEVVESVREPVRLGADVFATGSISEPTLEAAVSAFARFQALLNRRGIRHRRAVATSALREAANRDRFLERVRAASGIDVALIPPDEEARLVCLAVAEQVDLGGRTALLVDVGGGCVELSVVSDARILVSSSFRLGALRLLQELREPGEDEARFVRMVREYVDAARDRLQHELGRRTFDLCVGTGGNVESLADLGRALVRPADGPLTVADLDALLLRLERTPLEERVRRLGLRPDRADVIVPAAIVLQRILSCAGVEAVLVPRVGLREGALLDLAQSLAEPSRRLPRDQILEAALELGRRFRFDEAHGTQVARLSVALFDATRRIHGLDDEDRLLLEVSALLHDIGYLVGASGHHKHTAYLLAAAPLVGLDAARRAVVANVARYHRKAFPTLAHESYRALPPRDRVTVSKLAALLRMADALDREHAGRVRSVRVAYRKPRLDIILDGEGDLLLEKWALARKSTLFESVFGLRVGLHGEGAAGAPIPAPGPEATSEPPGAGRGPIAPEATTGDAPFGPRPLGPSEAVAVP